MTLSVEYELERLFVTLFGRLLLFYCFE